MANDWQQMYISVVVKVPNILSFLFHARDVAHAPVYNRTARSENHREQGIDLVLVLGPPSYYPRFGFDAGLARQVTAPYAGAAFQALALTPAARAALPIEVTFATPFEAFE